MHKKIMKLDKIYKIVKIIRNIGIPKNIISQLLITNKHKMTTYNNQELIRKILQCKKDQD